MTGSQRGWTRLPARLGGLSLSVLLTANPLPSYADPQEPTPLRYQCPDARVIVDGGRTDPLGLYTGTGVRCTITFSLTLTVGARYAEQRGYTSPFAILSYETSGASVWHLSLTGSYLERSGDYEIDRLPELGLWWTPQANESFLIPSTALFVGYIKVHNPVTETGRAGGSLNLSTRLLLIGPSANISANFTSGEYWYGSGTSYSYWTESLNLNIRPASATEIVLTYSETHGFGTSPLAFDMLEIDRVVTGRVGFTLNPAAVLSVSGTLTLLTSSMKQYDLSWTTPGEWTATLTWRLSDYKLLLSVTLPQ